jgi:hypothetical protein
MHSCGIDGIATGGGDSVSADNDVVYIHDKFEPPAVLEGSSVVYILRISKMHKQALPDLVGKQADNSGSRSTTTFGTGAADTWYVGETESIAQRLRQHRHRYQLNGGNAGAGGGSVVVSAVAVNVPNKSAARRIESTVISRMKSEGFVIERDADESHALFGA